MCPAKSSARSDRAGFRLSIVSLLSKLGFTKPYLGQHTTHPKQPKRPTQYCQEGHRLAGNGTGKGITDGGNKHSGLIITNGTVMNFGTGIDLSASSLITIELMDVSGNLVDGIFTGGSTTVTGICPSNVLKITGASSLRPHPPGSRRFR